MQVEGKFTISCNRCGKTYDFLKEDVKFVKSENDNTYVWELKYNCLRCENPISIRYEVSVSSDGSIKDKKVDIEGAKVVEDTFQFSQP